MANPAQASLPFKPCAEVALIFHALLDAYERRNPDQPVTRTIRVQVSDLALAGYQSQVDPMPARRPTTN